MTVRHEWMAFLARSILIDKGCFMKGKITQYKEPNGFGWIAESFNKIHYFHVSNWMADTIPVVGMEVEFEIGPGRKPGQIQAVNVTPISPASQNEGVN